MYNFRIKLWYIIPVGLLLILYAGYDPKGASQEDLFLSTCMEIAAERGEVDKNTEILRHSEITSSDATYNEYRGWDNPRNKKNRFSRSDLKDPEVKNLEDSLREIYDTGDYVIYRMKVSIDERPWVLRCSFVQERMNNLREVLSEGGTFSVMTRFRLNGETNFEFHSNNAADAINLLKLLKN